MVEQDNLLFSFLSHDNLVTDVFYHCPSLHAELWSLLFHRE